MARYIALLRGINVGGKNVLPMQSLRKLLEGIIPKLMDVSVTARNHRTVAKLVDMATARGG